MRRRIDLSFVSFMFVFLVGCGEKQPQTPSAGTYGTCTVEPSKNFPSARPDRSAAQPWTNGALSVIQTELSPATLYHARSKDLSFFTHMPETGLGGPSFAAIETEQGPKIF